MKKIPKNQILAQVMSAISKADTSINATMLLAEELEKPLPKAYFKLLLERMNAGIKVQRLAFGTKRELDQFSAREKFIHPAYFLFLAKDMDYRRMILIDQKKLFFKNKQGHFFFTVDPLKIQEFFTYFQMEIVQTQSKIHRDQSIYIQV